MNADEWHRIAEVGQKIIVDNLTHVKEITLWLTSGISVNGVAMVDNLQLHAVIVFDDDRRERLDYDIPADMLDELDSEVAMVGYAVEYLINHLILPQYFDKVRT